MSRIWIRPHIPPGIDWQLVGETSRSPSAAVAKALYERAGLGGPVKIGPIGEVLFEDPVGTTSAAFTISLATSASAIEELPEAPEMNDLDAAPPVPPNGT